MAPSRFDRLYETRRNRRFRNASLGATGVSLLLLIVQSLEPLFSGEPLQLGPLFLLGILCTASIALTVFFHLRFLSRE